jgi:hypothetical protein
MGVLSPFLFLDGRAESRYHDGRAHMVPPPPHPPNFARKVSLPGDVDVRSE